MSALLLEPRKEILHDILCENRKDKREKYYKKVIVMPQIQKGPKHERPKLYDTLTNNTNYKSCVSKYT